jgi:hypothetical protein
MTGWAALLLALAMPASLQERGMAGPQPWEQASRDGFGALALSTPDYDGFMREWSRPTPPTLPTTSVAARGQRVTFMLIFHGCRAGPDGNCNVTADFSILQPDGRPYGETQTAPIWRGPAVEDQSLRLAESGPALIVEPADPMGIWTIRARVTDHVRGVTVEVESRLRVETQPTGSNG